MYARHEPSEVVLSPEVFPSHMRSILWQLKKKKTLYKLLCMKVNQSEELLWLLHLQKIVSLSKFHCLVILFVDVFPILQITQIVV